MRKTTFARDDVIAAAVAVIDSEGFQQLTARKVADEMGASTAPVYSNFKTMEELALAAKSLAVEKMMALTEKPGQKREFIDIGEGVLLFAKNHPHLYDALFLQPGNSFDPGPQVMERILSKMETLPEFASLQPLERLILLKKMALFTLGMATEVCNGFLDNYEWRELLLLLEEVGDALVKAAYTNPPRKEQDIHILGTFWSKCSNGSNKVPENKPEDDSDD